jgi:large subunit ribosomal protein L4e
MFAPTQVTRRWFRKTTIALKRYAVASAIAATQSNALVLAHGHRTTDIPAIPLVIDMCNVEKTKDAIEILKNVKAMADVEASAESRGKRSGKGAMRNRRYIQKNGPMVVFAEGDNIEHGFRALSGVTLENVETLNLLSLAPGGHPGRFVIWTKKAFAALDGVYAKKTGFHMPAPMIKQTDFAKFFQSEAIVRAHRAKKATRYTESKNGCCPSRLNPALKK